MSVDELFSAGKLATITVDEPGFQGATVFGTQGAGVNRTGGGLFVAGLATLLHIPNGRIFALGLKSMIVAMCAEVFTVPGVAVRLAGTVPKLHIILALPQTHTAIKILLFLINSILLKYHLIRLYSIRI